VILLASTVSCALVLVEIAVVAPELLRAAITPLAILVMTLGVLSLPLWFLQTKGRNEMPSQGNPTELKGSATFFQIVRVPRIATIAALNARLEIKATAMIRQPSMLLIRPVPTS